MNIIVAKMKCSFKNAVRGELLGNTLGRLFNSVYIVIFSAFMFYYIMKGNVSSSFISHTGTNDYLSYIVVGSAFYIVLVSVLMAVGKTFMSDVKEGIINEILISPVHRWQLLLGNGLEQFMRSIIEVIFIFLIGLLLGVKFHPIDMFSCFAILLLVFLSVFSAGTLLAFMMIYMRETYLTQNTFFLLVNFLCGISFPAEYLPKVLAYVSNALPFTRLLNLIRRILIFGDNITCYFIEIIIITIMNIFILGGGLLLYSIYEKKCSDKFIL